VVAVHEAGRLNHNFVGTEHLLLGLISLEEGVAFDVLQRLGLVPETIHLEVEHLVGRGPHQIILGRVPYTPRAKKVLALAMKEARALDHSYIGTEHLLLGLLLEGDGVAARVLHNSGINIEEARQTVLMLLDPKLNPPATELNAQDRFKLTWKDPVETSVWSEIVPLEVKSSLTPRSAQVLALARKEARQFGHSFVDTGHLLLGLIGLGQGIGFNLLNQRGVELEKARAEFGRLFGAVRYDNEQDRIPYAPRAKQVLALAAKEARALNHTYIGTEHILLGLMHERDGQAALILKSFNIDLEQFRIDILRILGPIFRPGGDVEKKPEP
jgi:ATP-dependent Clp protease ATP-binding subunit ClpA